jgi:serine phosphatase RsbU (regulator of sigma subunit)
MTSFKKTLDTPTTARYHQDAVEQISQCVEDRVYCALLGPRLCGKTLLLRYIEQNLARLLGWTCVYIDLKEPRATTQAAFFADLIRQTGESLTELTGTNLSIPDESEAGSAVYRAFLMSTLESLESDLVLLFDPLEALPTDLVQALLTCLRAAYMDQHSLDKHLTVVVSGALSLAALTVGETSPFRGIARRVFIGDLSESESRELILEFLVENGISATRPAVQNLQGATSGDVFLIRRICQRGAELVHSRVERRLRSRDVTNITNRFLRDEVIQYAPLIEAIRLIEEDPDLVECILKLLEHDSVSRKALPLPLSPDLDPLYLTGVVDMVEDECYRLQNSIYRRFLSQHFTPGRVGYVLSMVGRWDSAIDYLEASILQGDGQSRSEIFPATINSIYASQDLDQAVRFLQRGMSAAFGVSETHVWLRPLQEKHLIHIGPIEINRDEKPWVDNHIPLSEDRLEARAYRHQVPLRGKEHGRQVVRAIPLIIPGRQPFGVVTIFDDMLDDSFTDQRERDLQMVGFLNQAARALQTVSARRQELELAGRVQASLLPDESPQIPGWQITATWKPARETSGDFYDFVFLPNGQLGIVIADVVDKGMGAALLMALSRTLIRSYALEYPDRPDQLLRVTNQRICADIGAGMFVTLFYGVLDPATGRLTYANAGHPPPYIISPDKNPSIDALPRTGMPLGISEGEEWTSSSTRVPPGGTFLLYTDGILDAQNHSGEFYGEQQMLDFIREQRGQPAQTVQGSLMSSVYTFAGTARQVDDITLMVLIRDR